MGQSILTFISHSSDDKISLIEPIVADLENCYINVWLDKRKIMPGDNLRKSIFRDGLDKADVALIFFTEKSLKSSWVDKEIKHVLREESKKGNNFDLNKIISIFDSKETYDEISSRYPELTDDLMHLMPINYTKVQLGQLISAIWSKYLSLQGGDVEVQRQLLSKEKQIFQKEKEVQQLKTELADLKSKNSNISQIEEFETYLNSGKIDLLIQNKHKLLEGAWIDRDEIDNLSEANAFGLVEDNPKNVTYIQASKKGKEFFKWLLLNKK
ncbi:toll/interleukin-1 receptor domain-containing protein [Formosa sp. 4Alg 33]|uniref:toll/interleukin-1 receptor domain-containing protein n=1 Tax=Formosa sp. 4Alg 33 TaxID=3382189 RepID=UPI003D9C48A5